MELKERMDTCLLYENMNKHKNLAKKLGLVIMPHKERMIDNKEKREFVDAVVK